MLLVRPQALSHSPHLRPGAFCNVNTQPVESRPTTDALGLEAYRNAPQSLVGYAVLVLGLLLFGWDASYVFLGITIELVIFLAGNIVRTWLSLSGLAAVFATLFHIPALLLAGMSFALSLSLSVVEQDPGTDPATSDAPMWTGWAGLVLFLGFSTAGAIQHFRATSLKQARFFERLNATYHYEDGRPLMGSLSLALGPIVESWLSLLVFYVSFSIAAAVGGCVDSPTVSAVTLVLLSLLRRSLQGRIIRRVHGPGQDQEATILAALAANGRILPK